MCIKVFTGNFKIRVSTSCGLFFCRRYEEDMYWRRMEEEQHHWEDRRRMPDGGYPQGPPGPPGLLGVRPGMPIPQPQGPVVSLSPTWSAVILSPTWSAVIHGGRKTIWTKKGHLRVNKDSHWLCTFFDKI